MLGPWAPQNRIRIGPKIYQKNDVVLELFWGRLGLPFGPSWAPKSGQDRPKRPPRSPQEAPRSLQDPPCQPYLCEKVIFQKVLKNTWKNNDFAPQRGPQIVPRWPQERSRWSKIAPRRLQDLPKKILQTFFVHHIFRLRFGMVFGSNLGSFSTPLGCPKRPQNRYKKHPKITLSQDSLEIRSKTASDPHRAPQRPPDPASDPHGAPPTPPDPPPGASPRPLQEYL